MTAVVGLVLAAVGLLLTVVGDLRDERGALFDLEAQGSTPAELRRHVLLRAAVVGGLGVAAGIGAGAIVGALVVAVVTVTAAAENALPPLALAFDWPLAAAALGALVARVGGGGGHRRAEGAVNAVEARDLFRLFASPEGTAVALQGLTLDVAEGELLVVFGPSGSGKSTLLRILAGLDRPSAGSVSVLGHDLRTLRGRALARVPLAHARLRRPALHARARAGAHRARARRAPARAARRRPRERASSVADGLLERVGLLDRRDALPAELSGGQQQRVAICAALAHRPKLFIADEPTGELDAQNAAQIYELIGALSRELGATTVLVSHDPRSAAVADRVVQIRDGRVSAEDGRRRRQPRRLGPHPEEARRRTPSVELEPAAHGLVIRIARARSGSRSRKRRRRAGEVVVAHDRPDEGVRRDAPCCATSRSSSSRAGCPRSPGRSGSGKSTLLHLLAGLDLPTAGEVHVLDDADLAARRDRPRARAARAHRRRHAGNRPRAVPDRAGDRRARARDARRADRRRLRRRSPPSGSRSSRASASRGSRWASGSASRSRARSPRARRSCSPTSRRPGSTRRTPARSARSSPSSPPATGTAIVCATHDPVLIEHAAAEVPLGTLAA